MSKSWVLVVGLIVAAGCGRGGAPAPAAPEWTALTGQRVYYDNAGGIRDSVRLVVRDAEALREVWGRATAGQAAPPPLPAVDFEREMLLVVGAGERSPEDRIQVDSIRVERAPAGGGPAALVAVVRLTEGCGRVVADSFPVEIVRVPRVAGEVGWVERRERPAECGRSWLDDSGAAAGLLARASPAAAPARPQ